MGEESLLEVSLESLVPSEELSDLLLDLFGASPLVSLGADASATTRRDLRTGFVSWISSIY